MKHPAHKGIPCPTRAPTQQATSCTPCAASPPPWSTVWRAAANSAPRLCTAPPGRWHRMHLAGRDYERQQPNLRACPGWNETVPVTAPHRRRQQRHRAPRLATRTMWPPVVLPPALPRGPVHADLFRDNVMFEGEQFTGFSRLHSCRCGHPAVRPGRA